MRSLFSQDNTRTFLAALILTALGAALAIGQTTGGGSISGTLTDPSGSVVAGASVAIRNTATGATRTIASNDAGIYVAQFLQPGGYEITASKTGFAKVLRTGLMLQVGQVLTIDIALPVQTTSDTVTVSAEAPIVDADKTEIGRAHV